MDEVKKTVTRIPRGAYPDSRKESRDYWRDRSGGERVAAARRLRRRVLRLLHVGDPSVVAKTVHPLRPQGR